MFSEGSPRPTLRFTDTKFIHMCGKDLEVWQIKWAPLSPSGGKASSCGKCKCILHVWMDGGKAVGALPPSCADTALRRLHPVPLTHGEDRGALGIVTTGYSLHSTPVCLGLECGSESPGGHVKYQYWVSPGFTFPQWDPRNRPGVLYGDGVAGLGNPPASSTRQSIQPSGRRRRRHWKAHRASTSPSHTRCSYNYILSDKM